MEHGTPDTQIVNSAFGGDEKCAEGEDGQELLNLPHATRHLAIAASSQPPPENKQSPSKQQDGTTSSFSRPIMTSVISLPSIGLACPVHRLHLKLASDFRRPGMPLHFLWIQLDQSPQKWNLCRCP